MIDKITKETVDGGFVTGIWPMIKRNAAGAAMTAICFFLGRAQIFGVLSPMAVAGASMGFMEGGGFYLSALFTMFGLATKFNAIYTIKYIITVGVMWFVNIILQGRLKKPAELTKYASAGVIIFLTGLSVELLRGLTAYGLMMCALEGVLTFSLSFIFTKGKEALVKSESPMTAEELLSAAFLLGGAILGAADIWIGWVSLRYLFCAFLILVTVYRAGGTTAAAAGLVLGVLTHAAGYETPMFAVVLAISGLICGFTKNTLKPVIGAVFTVVSGITALYFGIFRWELAVSFGLSSVLFIIAPKTRLLSGVRDMLTPAGISAEEYYHRVRALASDRLKAAAISFARLSAAFDGVYKPRIGLTKGEVSDLIEDVADKSCVGCVKYVICWEQDLYETYQKTYEVLKRCDLDGGEGIDVVSSALLDFCIRRREFYDAVLSYFELYKNDLKWRNSLNESRRMAAVQLSAAAGVLEKLANGMSFSGKFDWSLEKKVRLALLKSGFDTESVVVAREGTGLAVEISHKPCPGGRCMAILPVVSEVLGKKFKRIDKSCLTVDYGDKRLCRLRLAEERKLSVACGVSTAAISKTGESGDSYAHMESQGGQALLVLSDGMGTGRRARAESQATVELFEDFIESGFDKNVTVELINSALLLKSYRHLGYESYSTLDICAVDLDSGKAEFLKVGAAASYIVGGGGVDTIRSYSLPVGILDNVEPDTANRRVKHGDIIIMMTDGVLDPDSDEQKERWVASVMKRCKAGDPQVVADFIMAEAKKVHKDVLEDDMTVLVARVWEKL